MSQQESPSREALLAQFLGNVLENRSPDDTLESPSFGVGQVTLAGLAPMFWADAPWRLEPELAEIPFTFIVRDAHSDALQMELTGIAIYETSDKDTGSKWNDKNWHLVHTFSQGLGRITDRFWTYRLTYLPSWDCRQQ